MTVEMMVVTSAQQKAAKKEPQLELSSVDMKDTWSADWMAVRWDSWLVERMERRLDNTKGENLGLHEVVLMGEKSAAL